MWCWWYPLCTRSTHLVEVLVLWNNSSRSDISLHSGHIILIPSQYLFALVPYCHVPSKEAAYTTVFDLTRLEPTICGTRDEHAHHYTTYTFHNNKEFTETFVKGNYTWLHWGTDKYVTRSGWEIPDFFHSFPYVLSITFIWEKHDSIENGIIKSE
jgi:hypothetical protein